MEVSEIAYMGTGLVGGILHARPRGLKPARCQNAGRETREGRKRLGQGCGDPYQSRKVIMPANSGPAPCCFIPESSAAVRTAGCMVEDIVDATTFHTDPEAQFEDIVAVRSTVFDRAPYQGSPVTGPSPGHSAVQCSNLLYKRDQRKMNMRANMQTTRPTRSPTA